MIKTVFHIRLTDFELQVERLLDSGLRSRAVAIISSHHQNGTIIALSPEAAAEGFYPGLKVVVARKMSRLVTFLPYNASLYAKLHHYLYQTVSAFSPVVEPAGYGQYFADMTGMDGLYRTLSQAGYHISRSIQSRVNLNHHIGISGNKLVSKISTAVIPETIYTVSAGCEPQFLAPLYAAVLPVVQEKPVHRMVKFLLLDQVQHLQEIARTPSSAALLFGRYTPQLCQEAFGRDTSAVRPPALCDHLIEQTTLQADTNDEAILLAVVQNLTEQIAFQLRRKHQMAALFRLEIHYSDGYKNQRQGHAAANDNSSLNQLTQTLFQQANYRRNRIRAIVLDASHIRPAATQLNLFQPQPVDRLSQALDRIRHQHGPASIATASHWLVRQLAQPGDPLAPSPSPLPNLCLPT